ncbi:phage tail tape measure protein [Ampullimonas aquatilis]|uniref:phage tail tape measure protein n=1 Tax=Ampullimonas aquatilis TaxID=1341549 RepID=UPI003C738CDA
MSNDNELKVSIIADTGALKPGMDKGAADVRQAAQSMRDDFARLASEMRANTQAITTMTRQVAESSNDMRDSFASSTEGIQRSMEAMSSSVRGVMKDIAAALSIHAFVRLVGDAIDAADNLHDLSQKTGISAETLGGMGFAAEQAGGDLETMSFAANKLSKNIVAAMNGTGEAKEAFDKMGVSIKDASGHARGADEVMADLADKFASYKDGPEKAALAMVIFGRAGANLIPVLDDGGEKMRQNIDYYKQYSGVTTDLTNKSDQFNDTLEHMNLISKSFGAILADKMLPTLQGVADAMLAAKEKTTLFQTAADAATTVVKGLAVGGVGLATVFKVVGETIGAAAAQMYALAHGDFSMAATIGNDWKSSMQTAASDAVMLIDKIMHPEKYVSASSSGGGSSGGTGTAPTVGGKTKKEKAAHEKEGPKTFMAYYDAVLEQEKLLASERDAIHGMSKQEEVAYWEGILSNAQLVGNDRVKIEKTVANLQIQIRKEAAIRTRDLAAEDLKIEQMTAVGKIAYAQAQAQSEYDLGKISKQELLAQQQTYEQDLYNIKLQGLQQRQAVLEKDPEYNALELKKLKEELLKVEQDYQIKRLNLATQIQKVNPFAEFFQDFQSGMQGITRSALQGTLTIGGFFRGMGASVLSSVDNMIAKTVSGFTRAGAEMILTGKSVALQQIHTNAMAAGAAAYQAVVGIPVIGPALAPPAAAVAYAGTMAFASFSAEGGYDIPAGMNPITQLHQKEMVLPAEHADTIRNLAGGGGANSAPREVVFKGQHVGQDFFMMHKNEIKNVIKSLNRNFELR